MSQFFYNLTPDTIIQAIQSSGFEPTGHSMALNSYENRVFDLRLENGNHVVIKFYRPGRWRKEEIEEEHSFLFELDAQEIPVCKPFILPHGSTVGEIAGLLYAIWPRTGGRSADEFDSEQLSVLGRLIARIHNTGESRSITSRGILNADSYAIKSLEFLQKNHFIPMQLENRFQSVINRIAAQYEAIADGVPLHRIHGDCHPGNLLHGDLGWFFLDFDDFLTGPAVQDIWMLVPSKDSDRSIFLNAYRQFRDFDEKWLDLIEPLRALRYIHYAAWIGKRWEDPSFPLAFPHFGTESYWEELLHDLEEQSGLIEKTSRETTSDNTIQTNTREEELSNKDFFWDWED